MEDRIRKGQHAERLLVDELFVETFAALRQHALHVWETSAPQETEVREEAWRTVRVIDSIKMAFEKYAKDGKIDKQMLEHAKVDVHPTT